MQSLASLRVEASLDAQAYTAGANAKAAADAKMVASGQQVAGSLEVTERRLGGSAASWDRYRRTLEGVSPEQFKIEAGQKRLQGALDTGKISLQEHTRLVGLLQQRYSTLSQPLNDNTKAMGASIVSAGAMRASLVNLSAQVQDVGVSLLSGQAPWRVFIQQSGQIQQALTQGGGVNATLAAAGTAIRGMITPMTAAVAGAAALAGGLAILLNRAADNADEIRKFDAVLRGVGPASAITSTGLQKVALDLRQIGVSAKDATAALQAVGNNPALNRANPQAAAQLIDLGTNVGSRLGVSTTEGITKTNAALAGGVDDMVKLGVATRALNVDQATAIRLDAARGNSTRALNTAIGLMTVALQGEREKVISAAEAVKNTLGGAWDELLNKGAGNKYIQQINEGLVALTRNLSTLIETGKVPPNSVLSAILGLTPYGIVQGAQSVAKSITNSSGPASSPSIEPNATISGVFRRASPTQPATSAPLSTGGAIGTPAGGYPFPTLRNPNVRQSANPSGYRGDPSSLSLTEQDFGPGSPFGTQAPADLGTTVYTATKVGDQWSISGKPASVWQTSGVSSSGFRSGLYSPTSRVATGGANDNADVAGRTTTALSDVQKAHEKLKESVADDIRISKEWGVQQQVSRSYTDQYNSSLASGAQWWEAMDDANKKATGTRSIANTELQKAVTVQDETTAGVIRTTEAFKTSEAAGYRSAAAEEARVKVMQHGGDVATETRVILEGSAAAAINSAQKQAAAAQPQLLAVERLAEAAKRGAAAEHEVQLQNEASARTQDALAKAEASRNPGLIAQAKALDEAALAEVRRSDAAKISLDISRSINQRADQVQVVQLQTSMVGQAPEVITAATASLTAQLRLRDLGSAASKETVAADLASVDALSRANIELARATRESEKWNDVIRSVASQIDSSLTRSIEDAFSGNKVESWGVKLKSMLGSLSSQISSALFIKPLLGTIASAFGFGSATTSLGSFGSLFGTSSTSGTTSALGSGITSNTTTLTDSSGNVFTLLKDAGGVAKSIFDFGSGSSGLGFLDSLGSNLGFATNLQGPTLSGASLGSGSIFGSTTFSSFLGGAGAGFGAGTLLNSLVGGNSLTGTVGSGIGSLAGAAIGSIIPGIGTLIGGLIGGAGGGLLGGMFGSKSKPSNSSGGLIDISTGAISGLAGEGTDVNKSASNEFIESISDFTKELQDLTDGKLTGSLNPQVYTNQSGKTVYKLGYTNVGDFGTGEIQSQDPDELMDTIKLGLAQSLTDISDTMRTVIDSITDPADLDRGVAFAAVYDNLKEAADSAFASISTDTQKMGPFETALEEIGDIFDEITDSANEFGLSLEPINAGLAETTKRLLDDHAKLVADSFLLLDDPVKYLVQVEKEAGEARLKDAIAINANRAEVERLNAATLDAVWKEQTQSLKDLQEELRTGSLAGLTGAASVTAANDNFKATLALVQGGSLAEIATLATRGTDLISASETAYGNAPRTAGLRTDVLAAVDDVLENRSFASGGITPPGLIRVGESGPEWMWQSGGSTVYPSGTVPGGGASNGSLERKLDELLAEMRANTRVNQSVGSELVVRIDETNTNLKRPAITEPPRRLVA